MHKQASNYTLRLSTRVFSLKTCVRLRHSSGSSSFIKSHGTEDTFKHPVLLGFHQNPVLQCRHLSSLCVPVNRFYAPSHTFQTPPGVTHGAVWFVSVSDLDMFLFFLFLLLKKTIRCCHQNNFLLYIYYKLIQTSEKLLEKRFKEDGGTVTFQWAAYMQHWLVPFLKNVSNQVKLAGPIELFPFFYSFTTLKTLRHFYWLLNITTIASDYFLFYYYLYATCKSQFSPSVMWVPGT